MMIAVAWRFVACHAMLYRSIQFHATEREQWMTTTDWLVTMMTTGNNGSGPIKCLTSNLVRFVPQWRVGRSPRKKETQIVWKN